MPTFMTRFNSKCMVCPNGCICIRNYKVNVVFIAADCPWSVLENTFYESPLKISLKNLMKSNDFFSLKIQRIVFTQKFQMKMTMINQMHDLNVIAVAIQFTELYVEWLHCICIAEPVQNILMCVTIKQMAF
uniref:Uncharacterized protein n=1 Tax=Anguilla anguilla TaxID=7936 RepID=A0A0E9X422_ANGAN